MLTVMECGDTRRGGTKTLDRRSAMKKMVCGLAIVGAMASSPAHAQLKIDMTLVTCAQYLAMPRDQAANFAAWMSGWFNQKQGYAWINLEAYSRNVANVTAFCAANPNDKVMDVLQRTTQK
jgi:HdeA/HdeB family